MYLRRKLADHFAPLAVLAGEFQVRVADTVVSGKRIGAAECLLLGAHIAPDLFLPCIVDGTLVSGQIVGSRENRVARLASARVDALAFVRSCLRVQQGAWYRLWPARTLQTTGLAMTVAFVFLQQGWRLESHRAIAICAGVRAAIPANCVRPPGAARCRWDGGGRRA